MTQGCSPVWWLRNVDALMIGADIAFDKHRKRRISFKQNLKWRPPEEHARDEGTEQSDVVRAQRGSGSFSAAARRLGLTAAAVSRNVARLETQLGLRLFHRSTRHLTLTESGERFYREAGRVWRRWSVRWPTCRSPRTSLPGPQVEHGPSFGADYIVPLLPEFVARYPAILPDLHLENRPVDLIQEGFDAAIGGGFDLPSGVVARELARLTSSQWPRLRMWSGRASLVFRATCQSTMASFCARR
jgi:hypothetical protein